MITSIVMTLLNIGMSIFNYQIGNSWVSGFCACAALAVALIESAKHF